MPAALLTTGIPPTPTPACTVPPLVGVCNILVIGLRIFLSNMFLDFGLRIVPPVVVLLFAGAGIGTYICYALRWKFYICCARVGC